MPFVLPIIRTAGEILFAPVGNIASADVQAALAELDTEKVPYSGASGAVNLGAHNFTTTGTISDGVLTLDDGAITGLASISDGTATWSGSDLAGFGSISALSAGNTFITSESSNAAAFPGFVLKHADWEWTMQILGGLDDFYIGNTTGGTTPFTIKKEALSNTLVLDVGGVGIGTTAPNAPLEVKGAKPAGNVGGFQSGMFHVTGDGDAEFSNSVITGHNAYNTNTQLWYLGSTSSGNNNIAFINRQNAAMYFHTNDAFRMIIDAAGNVGIGVTDPDATLEILDTTTQLKLSYDATNYFTFAVQSDGDLTLDSNKASYDLDFGDGNLSTTGLGTFGALVVDTDTLVVNAAGYAGKVGIGTTTPESDLHIHNPSTFGVLRLTGSGTSYTRAYFRSTTDYGHRGTGAYFECDDTDNSRYGTWYIGGSYTAADTTFHVGFNTNNYGGGGNIAASLAYSCLTIVGATKAVTFFGDVAIDSDSSALQFGAGQDASVYFDGSDLIINSENVTANDEIHFTNFDAYLFDNKIIFTQIDGNEFIDSLNDGYMDYGATTGHRFNSDVILPKTSGKGIKVDAATPTFGWRDLRAEIRTRGGGASDPGDATYQGNIKAYSFLENDEAWIEFHIPHDYVAGTDIHLHFHWSHNSALVTGGTVMWAADVSYAKGHDQAAFSATVNPTLSPSASTTQYQHMVSEVQLSAGTPSGTQIDTDDLEPDGLIIARVYLSSNDITSSGAVPDPFLHEVDVHYQSSNIATKSRTPDFYT